MSNPANKDKAGKTSGNTQALQVVVGVPPASTVGGSTPADTDPLLPRVVSLVADPPRRSTSSDTSTEELSPALLETIQQIVSAAIREQMATLDPARVATLSEADALKEETKGDIPVPVPPVGRRQEAPLPAPQEVPPQWFARLEYLQKGLQEVQYQIGGTPEDNRQGIPFTEAVMSDELPVNCHTPAIAEYDGTIDPPEHLSRFENVALLHRYTDGIKCRVFVTTFARAAQQWFNQLPTGAIGSFQEFQSLFLYQFASNRKLRKTELSLFAVRQKDNEPLKEYLQRFNVAALEVPSSTRKSKPVPSLKGSWTGTSLSPWLKSPFPSLTPS
ncbi:UNVERIFIED_CONTAM: hypothetical protein Slati_2765200 [Sesamum latifolium]|uniref:Retrotransposon gag domain-containing protein n=1 Tax=Sesamum latifolium TaxID=2727402 RepID=A0AAW2VZ62_9LAMI